VAMIVPTSVLGNVARRVISANPRPRELQMVKLDVTNESSVKDAVLAVEHQLQGKGLDYLVYPTYIPSSPVGDQSLTPALLTK
jgi:hypothetical protein